MKKFVPIAIGMLLSGCTFFTQNNLDLTVLKNNKPASDYEIGLRVPVTYGQHPMSPYFNSREMFTLGTFYTDAEGKLRFPFNAAIGIPPRKAKPMFLISSSDIKQCELLLWYLEEKEYFVSLKFENGDIVGPIKYQEDVTGDFKYNGNGWDITATINRIDRICTE